MVRVLAALSVACVLIIAAVVGLTYAVVEMSKDTSVENLTCSSARTGCSR